MSEAAPESFVNPFTPVESQALGEVDANLAGLIDEFSGGFPSTIWSGSNRLIIETLLARIPAAASSPAMIGLARRLLLSRAQDPQGATRGVSLIAARLDRALAIGQVSAVEPLAARVPGELDRPPVLGARVDALLYEGKDKEACELAEHARGRASDAAWAKRLGFCSALAGKVAEARLATDVLSDTGDEDEAFAGMMAKWVDKAKVKQVSLANPSAVHFALLRQTQVPLDSASLKNAGPAFLTAWAAYTKAPQTQRLAAAELAAASGVLPVQALMSLYLEAKLKPELLDAPFDPQTMPSGPQGAAFAVQRLTKTDDQVERGKLVAAAIDASKERGALPGVVGVLRSALAGLEPKPELADQAVVLGTAEMLAGDQVKARRWFDLLAASGRAESEAGRALRSLLVVRGGADDLAWSQQDFLSRINATKPGARARADLEWALLRALGTAHSDAVAIAALDGPLYSDEPSPEPAVVDGLKAAALGGRVGETVVFSLIALGPGGPRGAHPAALSLAIAALKRAGLEADARAIAAEALAWRMP